MGMTYTLSEEDLQEVSRLAEDFDSDKPNTCHEGTVTKEQSEAKHRTGLKGEIAFAREYGLDLDSQHYPSGDPGYDFRIYMGLTLDVKTRSQDSGNDLAMDDNILKPKYADIFVLANELGDRRILLAGWTTKARIAVNGTVKPLEEERLLCTKDELWDMEKLERWYLK